MAKAPVKPKKSTKKKTKGVASKRAAPSVVVGSEPLEDERHEVFCSELLLMKPQVRAYLRAFPEATYNSARAASTRLLTRVSIVDRVKFLRDEQRTKYRMDADDVHARLVMAASVDLSDLEDENGKMIPLRELPPEVRLCIESVEHDDIEVGTGKDRKHIGMTTKVKMISKGKALELLGRNQGMFHDKLRVSGGLTLEQLVCGEEEEQDE